MILSIANSIQKEKSVRNVVVFVAYLQELFVVFNSINVEQQQYWNINGCCFLVVFVETLIMVLFKIHDYIRVAVFINHDMVCYIIRITKYRISLSQIFRANNLLIFISRHYDRFIKRETPQIRQNIFHTSKN